MRPITVSVGPLAAASATNIRTASSGLLGTLVLNGTLAAGGTVVNGAIVPAGQAALDSPRQIRFTTAASEAGHTILLTGTSRSGVTQSETIALPASATTVDSVLSYATVTSVVLSANSNNSISIGTNTVSDSAWVRFDEWADWVASYQTEVSGTVNYTVQTTYDDPNSPTDPVAPALVTWVNAGDTNVVNATAGFQSSFAVLPLFARILLNSSTSPGFVKGTFVQTGNVRS